MRPAAAFRTNLAAVYGHAAGTISSLKVASLNHESRDDPVEACALVSEPLGQRFPVGLLPSVSMARAQNGQSRISPCRRTARGSWRRSVKRVSTPLTGTEASLERTFGATSSYSLISILPADLPPISISRNTLLPCVSTAKAGCSGWSHGRSPAIVVVTACFCWNAATSKLQPEYIASGPVHDPLSLNDAGSSFVQTRLPHTGAIASCSAARCE